MESTQILRLVENAFCAHWQDRWAWFQSRNLSDPGAVHGYNRCICYLLLCDVHPASAWLRRDGYNKWRDAKKPTTILAELCRRNGIQTPEYRTTEVKVLNKIFKIPPDAVPEGTDV